MLKYEIQKLISEYEIQNKIIELARDISNDFIGEEVLLIGLLRGSVYFLSDLSRQIQNDAKIDFMVVSSYGNEMDSSRDVKIIKDLEEEIKGKNVVIIEDIIDTGNTLKKVKEMLLLREPKSLKICTLLDKPDRREVQIDVDYVGFQIPDVFVVGYGIDYEQKHRTLSYIGKVVEIQ